MSDAVSEELETLLQAGIIETIDASSWVSPIAVIQKKSGDMGVCVSGCCHSYPLPHIDEMLPNSEIQLFYLLVMLISSCLCMKTAEKAEI